MMKARVVTTFSFSLSTTYMSSCCHWIIVWFSWFEMAKSWTTKYSSSLYLSALSNTLRWIVYFIKETIDMTTNWNIQSLCIAFHQLHNSGHVSVSIILFFLTRKEPLSWDFKKVYIFREGPPPSQQKKIIWKITFWNLSHKCFID